MALTFFACLAEFMWPLNFFTSRKLSAQVLHAMATVGAAAGASFAAVVLLCAWIQAAQSSLLQVEGHVLIPITRTNLFL
jgi:hypothetical protein